MDESFSMTSKIQCQQLILIPAENRRYEPNSKRFEPLYCIFLAKGCEGLPSAAIAKR